MDFSQNDLLAGLVERARAGQRVGLVTDVDGTISPIAPTPEAAQVTPRSRDLLRRLAGQIALVAAVSGRAADDLSARVGIPEMVYVGNHGLERMRGGEIAAQPEAVAARPALERVIAALQPRLLPGMILEDKRVTLSIHYRQTADPAAAEADFAPLIEQVVSANGLRLFRGRMVFEVRPAVEVNKGTAFARLVADHALEAAVYLGDDVTDADALIVASALRRAGSCYALGIGVESAETPVVIQEEADLLVAGVSGVEAFLDWFSSALSAS